jgi:hypothetical protein
MVLALLPILVTGDVAEATALRGSTPSHDSRRLTDATADVFQPPKAGGSFGSSAGGGFNPLAKLVDNDCLKPGPGGDFPLCDPEDNKCCVGLQCIR